MRSSPWAAYSQKGAPSSSTAGESRLSGPWGISTPQQKGGGRDSFAGGDQTGGGTRHLRGARPPQLLHALVDEVEAVHVRLAEPAAAGVEGQPPADLQGAAFGERPALAPAAE